MRTTTRSWCAAWVWTVTLGLGGCGLLGGVGARGGDGRCGRNMDADEFAEDFFDVMCAESASCGDADIAQMWCESSATGTTGAQECEFDRDAACDCLSGTYTCNEDLTGFAFVEPPGVCVQIFTCGDVALDTD